MKRVKDLIAELQAYPARAYVYAYEGECTGIVVVSEEERGGVREQLGIIEAACLDENECVRKALDTP